VKSPSGLYRLSAQVRGAKVVGGWIVLADGTQVGVLSVDGQAQPAPQLDTSTGGVVVDGTAATAAPVDGTTLN
jgi:serine/threonine-protein kinase